MSPRVTFLSAIVSLVCTSYATAAPLRATASSTVGVNVADFGATPNDLMDDTKAIQAAIDSLPRGLLADGAISGGGVVNIPRGLYRVGTLRIYSGVVLRGEGTTTVLQSTAADPAIQIATLTDNGYSNWPAVEMLTVLSTNGSCIGVDSSKTKCITAGRLERLSLRGKKMAVDLRGAYCQDVVVRDVKVNNGGSAALWIEGNANCVDRLNTEGSDFTDFALPDKVPARVNVVGQGNTIQGCIVEIGSKPATSYYCRGLISWTNNWMEATESADKVAYIFDDCGGQIDNLHLITNQHRAKFMNCRNLQIRQLDITGDFGGIDSFVQVDDKSSITIDQVASRVDCGWLDHPNVRIRANYNRTSGVQLDNPPIARSSNLVSDATLKTVQPGARRGGTPAAAPSGWRVWEDSGKAEFTLTPETTDDGKPSLRVDVTKAAPTNIGLAARLNVPAGTVGKRGVLQVTVDGPEQIFIWNTNFADQYPIRSMGQRTMALSPAAMVKDEEVIFQIPAKTVGTYHVIDLQVTR